MEKSISFRERVSMTQLQMPGRDVWKPLLCEFITTFVMMIVGVAVCMYLDENDKPNIVAVAFCWGFTVASLAQSLGHSSGVQMNPAVTIAMLVTRKIELVKAILFMIVQCVSATAAVAFLKILLPSNIKGAWGVIGVHDKLTPLQGFGLEFFMTFLLVYLIFAQSDPNRTDVSGSGPLSVGFLIVVLIFFGGNLTGTGMNPARAMGPAIIEGNFDYMWIYWVGPIGGALTAGVLYENVFRVVPPAEREAAEANMQRRAQEQEEEKKKDC